MKGAGVDSRTDGLAKLLHHSLSHFFSGSTGEGHRGEASFRIVAEDFLGPLDEGMGLTGAGARHYQAMPRFVDRCLLAAV